VINETLALIKHHTGLELKLCPYFTGIHTSAKGKYFNVVLEKPLFDSPVYTTLEVFAEGKKLIRVEPNGYMRLAIFNLTILQK
jgi:hypothetical protein